MTGASKPGVFLEFRGLTKHFPGVFALDGVGFSVVRGTCHALIGANDRPAMMTMPRYSSSQAWKRGA